MYIASIRGVLARPRHLCNIFVVERFEDLFAEADFDLGLFGRGAVVCTRWHARSSLDHILVYHASLGSERPALPCCIPCTSSSSKSALSSVIAGRSRSQTSLVAVSTELLADCHSSLLAAVEKVLEVVILTWGG